MTPLLSVVLAGVVCGLVGFLVGARSAQRPGGAGRSATDQLWAERRDGIAAQLESLAQHLSRLEAERTRDSAGLMASVQDLRRSTDQIRQEAQGLAVALNDNAARGTWGEMQLRRVLEHAGMVPHADFVEQQSFNRGDERLRPDVVVRLPNGRCVVVDSKAPLAAYLRASSTTDPDERSIELAAHARAVAGHVDHLARRGYDTAVEGSVDFVVLFLPGESFLGAALEAAPDLLEHAARQGVVLASPSTLLAFLRGVAAGWQERRVGEEAAAIAELGKELHQRIAVFAEHFDAVGLALERAVVSYNGAAGSMQRRLLVSARRLEGHAVGSGRTVQDPTVVDERPAGGLTDLFPTGSASPGPGQQSVPSARGDAASPPA